MQFTKNGIPKFQPIMVSSFEIIALWSRKSKKIDLYCHYRKNKLQALLFAFIIFVFSIPQSWNLALNIHYGLFHQPVHSFNCLVTCT